MPVQTTPTTTSHVHCVLSRPPSTLYLLYYYYYFCIALRPPAAEEIDILERIEATALISKNRSNGNKAPLTREKKYFETFELLSTPVHPTKPAADAPPSFFFMFNRVACAGANGDRSFEYRV